MYPKGEVYNARWSRNSGEARLRASKLVRFVYGLMRGIGAGLIGFAVILVLFTLGPVVKQEINYQASPKFKASGFEKLLDKALAEDTARTQSEASALGLDASFSLYIPQIDARAKIVANVNPTDEKEYREALQRGVAHARGTAFPGQGKLIYLFAHSTDSAFNFERYNAVFYLLGKLSPGDKITIFFADKKYVYETESVLIRPAGDTSWLTEKGEGEKLILQTCYPPGTTWQRLLVVAKPRS